MRKLVLFAAAVLFGIGAHAATYGILVNNATFYEAAALGEKDHQGRDQFKASVSLNAGDVFCVYDETNNAKFTIAMEEGEGSAKSSFTEGAESATCNTAGCYDFYIKLKYNADELYIGECQGDTPGGGEDQEASYGIMINGTEVLCR